MESSSSLAKLLSTRYSSLEAEKEACAAWAAPILPNQTRVPPSRLKALRQMASPDITVHPFWSAVVWFVAIAWIFYFGIGAKTPSLWSVAAIVAGAILLSRGTFYNYLLHWVLHPHAKRAWLWLAWLGASDALRPLLKCWRLVPIGAAQTCWVRDLEATLTQLLDTLPCDSVDEKAQQVLERLLRRCLILAARRPQVDWEPTRAYLLVAALRVCYGTVKAGETPILLEKMALLPVDHQQTPNRLLVRDVARLYLDAMEPSRTASSGPTTTGVAEPSLTALRAFLMRRF